MKICTPQQMQEIDRKAIQEMNIPGLTLMENAGRLTYEMIERHFGSVQSKKVVVVCGKGNNGGDGFVVARYLKENGAIVKTFLLCPKHEVKGDAATNLDKADKLGISITEIIEPSQFALENDTWLIVDAIFGTGFQGNIKPPYDEIINIINESTIPVAAVDCPSGLDGTTGKISDPIIIADLTVTFGLPKIGQAIYPGKAFCGILEVVDISFPSGLDSAIKTHLITSCDAAELLPIRHPDSHKGSFGKLFVLAGSIGYTGAAALTSLSGLRSGTGLVILGIPSSLNAIMEIKVTEVITRPLPDVKKGGHFALRGMGEIRQQIDWADAIAIGPGIGTHHETAELVTRLIQQIEKPLVLDADGLNIIAKNKDALKQHKCPLIISPHPGELSRLTGLPIEQIESNRFDLARQFASEYNLVLILKGAPSLVALPSGELYINYSGNDGMATAGSGDVLTGLIGGFLAQGVSAEQSAILATHTHGLAGDIAADSIGHRGMIASDILDCLPQALVELEEQAQEP
jgi:ADP-dependent NAD(P)H-hydrate dehydratase / NAD(P)H-hydrate epimerase